MARDVSDSVDLSLQNEKQYCKTLKRRTPRIEYQAIPNFICHKSNSSPCTSLCWVPPQVPIWGPNCDPFGTCCVGRIVLLVNIMRTAAGTSLLLHQMKTMFILLKLTRTSLQTHHLVARRTMIAMILFDVMIQSYHKETRLQVGFEIAINLVDKSCSDFQQHQILWLIPSHCQSL